VLSARFTPPRLRIVPLAVALLCSTHPAARAQEAEPADGVVLRPSQALTPPLRGEAARALPILLRAQTLTGRPDHEFAAEGNAEFRRGGMVIRADRLSYDPPSDLATALGHVHISRDGNIYTGPEMQLKVQRFEGFFVNPVYHFSRTGAGGSASRVDFIDEQRSVALGATYTSCPNDGPDGPVWLLSTERVSIDFSKNEGVAEKAVLRFYGVPILAAPRLSFPLTDDRKSGWLPPNISLDTKSGLQFSMPYFWNIAPNRDATFTPSLSTRRGPGLESEFRYLEPGHAGELKLNVLPYDRVTGTTRYALNAQHESEFEGGTRVQLRALQVSDDDYWKDFPRDVSALTPRLLATDLQVSRPFSTTFGNWAGYARVQRWQVLQTADPTTRIEAPYERMPQIGARYEGRAGSGFELNLETEFNRFTNPENPSGPPLVLGAAVPTYAPRLTGARVHALGSISRPFVAPGWSVIPKLALNAAAYSLDSNALAAGLARSPSRVIPSVSLDSAWVFERDTRFFGRSVRQTLEPRLLYVNTPFRDQSKLPNFDASAKDFNVDSIFSDNAFSGVDRVSDAHQVTAGLTTRVLDPDTGAEALRLGLAQRYLFRDQRITPDGAPLTRRFSDLLLLGSTTLVPNWTLDASLQYSPDIQRLTRSVVGARYSPGPYRTVSATYRSTRGLSEQVELAWQWPIYGPLPEPGRAARRLTEGSAGASCNGSWYAVGRVNYSTLESRFTDAVAGVEYDAGCWIGRVVATRSSTSRSEATTRLLLQLELVGLSKLGTNPLQVLKDNIPGYKLLREDRAPAQPLSTYD
jgi:LPS-assembly protein